MHAERSATEPGPAADGRDRDVKVGTDLHDACYLCRGTRSNDDLGEMHQVLGLIVSIVGSIVRSDQDFTALQTASQCSDRTRIHLVEGHGAKVVGKAPFAILCEQATTVVEVRHTKENYTLCLSSLQLSGFIKYDLFHMKTFIRQLLLLSMVSSTTLSAQNVGINATGIAPDGSAMLDIVAADKGVLIPRVALTATNLVGPVATPIASLLVYNTATAGVAPNNVTPGYYFWTGLVWSRLLNAGLAWQTNGNVLTGTEFMGSTNSQAVRFVANSVERMRINPVDGEVVVGALTSGLPGDMFSAVSSTTLPWAVNGYSSFNGGGVYGQVRAGTATLYGAVQGEYAGAGTALAPGAGVLGIYAGTSTFIDRAGVDGSCDGPLLTNGGAGVSGYNSIPSGIQHMGVLGSYAPTAYGAGVYGLGFGGGFPAGLIDFAVVGWRANNANFSGYFNGNHVVANGTKTASVGTSKGNQLLYVTESPEVWFEDVGTGRLVNGEAHIEMDPLFLETVVIDAEHPMHAFIQLQGDCNGVFVETGTTGFQVRELQHGSSNAPFSYRVMAKRVHFQDHRFGNDPVWGAGDTRPYMQYASPPPVDHEENLRFHAETRANWKQSPVPEGFVPFSELQRKAAQSPGRK